MTERPATVLSDAVRSAYHNAAHTVAMFRLGFGVQHRTIEPSDGLAGCCVLSIPPELLNDDTPENRAAMERLAIALHAGNAAERHLRPINVIASGADDHRNVHRMLRRIEAETSVAAAWCCHLWQRAYRFIADPWQWRLVHALADALLATPRLLSAPDATALLTDHAARLEHDHTMPDFQLAGSAPTPLRSPWHGPTGGVRQPIGERLRKRDTFAYPKVRRRG